MVKLSQLRSMSHQLAQSSPKEKLKNLAHAFELFSQETHRLEKAYDALKEQFEQVDQKLQQTNRQLAAKVAELDGTTSYLHGILRHMAQGILFVDKSGAITTYNEAAEKIMSKPAAEVLHRCFWDCFSDELFGFSMKQILNEEKPRPLTYAILEETSRQQGRLEIEVSTSWMLQSSGPSCGLVVLLRDMTDLRRLQRVTGRNDRMKELGEMAAAVAHEIRNPLSGIRGFASLLHRDLASDSEKQRMADYIIEGTETLDRLVTNVLNYCRPMPLQLQSVDLTHFVPSLGEFLRVDGSLGEKIRLDVQVNEKPFSIPLDPERMHAALLNLVLNAVQAMPNGGTLSLRVRRNGPQAIIEISDTGMGIPEQNLEKIFRPFFTTKPEGNGFGLAEVHKIVQAHGGTIEVHSQVGEGSTFIVKLPTE